MLSKRTRMTNKPIKKLIDIPTPDEALLNLLQRSNANLSKPRLVHFYLYFPSQQKAEAAKTELSESSFGNDASFEVDISEPLEGSQEWLCLATREVFPNASSLKSIRKKLEILAHKFDGIYDGLETGLDDDFL